MPEDAKKPAPAPASPNGDRLLAQFFMTLRTAFAAARASASRADAPVVEAIEGLFARKPESWSTAYEIEQLLVRIYPEETLDVELDRRIAEAIAVLGERGSAYWAQVDPEAIEEADDQREVLGRLVNDLQWHYSQGHVKRVFIREIMRKIDLAAVGVFVAFFVLLAAFTLTRGRDFLWQLAIAVTAGAVGSTFSMLMGMRGRLDASTASEVATVRYSAFLPSRLLVGMVGGAIVFFFMRSGYVSGDLFPNLAKATTERDFAAISGLVVWALISGFSEKFVPGLLAQRGAKT